MAEAMRREFEAHYEPRYGAYALRLEAPGQYAERETQIAWASWQAAAAAEREQCAKACERRVETPCPDTMNHAYEGETYMRALTAEECAAAIRNRKEPA
jgi:hypothetical protein